MPDTVLESNVAFQMASIIYRLDQILRDTILRELDLTYVHFRVLQYLYQHDGAMIGQLATAIVVRQPVLSRVVDQMQERGLVQRQADPDDSRRTRVYLTDEGRNRFQVAWPLAHELLEDSLQGFESSEREQFLALLHKMAGNVLK